MDRLASKTGGLFNLKEMAKAKERRQVIDCILNHYRQNCADQNISAYLFEDDWKKRLECTSLRDLKRELKLQEATKLFMETSEISIGTKFIRQGRKNKAVETVIDIYKTYNSKGELVKTRYVTEKEFMGQTLKDYDVVLTTIKIGLLTNPL